MYAFLSGIDKMLPFQLTGVSCKSKQSHILRPDGFPDYQWIQCRSGQGELIVGNETFYIKPNMGMFLYPGERHEYYPISELWEVAWITFNGYAVNNLIKTIGIDKSGAYYTTKSGLLLTKIEKTFFVTKSSNARIAMESSLLVYELLLDMYKYLSKNSDDSIHNQYLMLYPAIDYMEKNYSSCITLNDLAGVSQVTSEHFCRLFRKITKLRPFEYLNNLRISKSKEIMLTYPDKKITEVASLTGYENASYFCQMFKKVEGMTPGEFKKMYGIN